MGYILDFTEEAKQDIKDLQRSSPVNYKKVVKLLVELMEHPTEGAGKPKPMKYGFTGCWSRRIDHKNRLVYKVENDIVTVTVLSALGHYGDK